MLILTLFSYTLGIDFTFQYFMPDTIVKTHTLHRNTQQAYTYIYVNNTHQRHTHICKTYRTHLLSHCTPYNIILFDSIYRIQKLLPDYLYINIIPNVSLMPIFNKKTQNCPTRVTLYMLCNNNNG